MMTIEVLKGMLGPLFVSSRFLYANNMEIRRNFNCGWTKRRTFDYNNILLLSQYRSHRSNSGDIVNNIQKNEIPIAVVNRMLRIEEEDKNRELEPKIIKAATKAEGKPSAGLKVRRSETEIKSTDNTNSKALVPYASNAALRNVWRRPTPQRPTVEDLQNSNFKETYEKLRKLGLLKARMNNCHIGMTSPSGKRKMSAANTSSSRVDAVKPVKIPGKMAEINSKFLQNNVVLKVQHYYNSQGKDMPDELKSLTRGSCRNPPSGNVDLKRRRYQVYPCTSPSFTNFTRISKKRK